MENLEKYFDNRTLLYMNNLDNYYKTKMSGTFGDNEGQYQHSVFCQYDTSNNVKKLFSVKSKCNIVDMTKCLLRKNNFTIFYHNDLDGKSSASMIVHMIENSCNDAKIEFVEYNYKPNDKTFNEVINTKKENSVAIIVDLSITKGNLNKIFNNFEGVIWIDHHITSISVGYEIIKNDNINKDNFIMLLDTEISAAYITYFFIKYCSVSKHPYSPYMAKIVSDYDTWNLNNYPTYQLGLYLNQYFFSMNTLDPTHCLWTRFLFNLDNALLKILTIGEKLYNIEQIKMEIMYNAEIKYRMKYKDYSFVALNGYGNSFRFTGIEDANCIKILVRKNVNTKEISVSAYGSTKDSKLNLGIVFKKYFNGGGHAQAAGFNITIDDFLIRLKEIFNDDIEMKEYIENKCEIIYDGPMVSQSMMIESIVNYLFMVFIIEIDELD